jgi:hypothetical protein
MGPRAVHLALRAGSGTRWSLIEDLYGQTSSAQARVIANHHWLDARRIPVRIEPAGAQADMRRLPIVDVFSAAQTGRGRLDNPMSQR